MYKNSILRMLKETKRGLLGQELQKRLSINSKDNTKIRKFRKSINQLGNEISKEPIHKLPKHFNNPYKADLKSGNYKRMIYFLPKDKSTASAYWELDDKETKQKNESENIYASCIFVQYKILSRMNGYLTPFEKENTDYWERFLPLSLLSVLLKYRGNSDFIIFLVVNKGNGPINGIKASLNIDPRIRKPSSMYINKLCTIRKHSNRYNIEFDELYPNDTAYLIVPLTKDRLNFEVNVEELKPEFLWEITGWYQGNHLIVREGTFTEDIGFDGTFVDWRRKEVTSS